jgi:mycoredoxin
MQDVSVYGMDWCEDTQRVVARLRDWGVSCEYFNLENDERSRDFISTLYPGGYRTPIVIIEGSGTRLEEPADAELRTALKSDNLIDSAA